jgi:hypothetical protein
LARKELTGICISAAAKVGLASGKAPHLTAQLIWQAFEPEPGWICSRPGSAGGGRPRDPQPADAPAAAHLAFLPSPAQASCAGGRNGGIAKEYINPIGKCAADIIEFVYSKINHGKAKVRRIQENFARLDSQDCQCYY